MLKSRTTRRGERMRASFAGLGGRGWGLLWWGGRCGGGLPWLGSKWLDGAATGHNTNCIR
jgi:hypothetical protein